LFNPKYDKLFNKGYENALTILETYSESFNNHFKENEDKALAVAIVFPEMIRYSYLIDFFEARAMELIYIHHGKEKINFSIGRFQMKPSFVESIEESLGIMDKERYEELFCYEKDDIVQIRKDRIARMKSVDFQVQYLKAFIDIMNKRYEYKIWSSIEEKIAFYAAAYNYGYLSDELSISKHMTKKTFPYGLESDKKQYSYADISVYFFQNDWDDYELLFSKRLYATQ